MADTLAASLVAALQELTTIDAANTVNAGSFSYKYADLGDVVKLTRPILAKNGLVALTPIVACEGGLGCLVIIIHASGERLDLGPVPFPHGRDAQATGSMITYHRRYALVAALGLAAGADDDGATAVSAQREPRAASGGKMCALCGESLAGSAAKRTAEGLAHKECAERASTEASASGNDESTGSEDESEPVIRPGDGADSSAPTLEGIKA
jgi:hypothetical protein